MILKHNKLPFFAILIMTAFAFFGCVQPKGQVKGVSQKPPTTKQAQGTSAIALQTTKSVDESALYTQEPPPLTPVQCAQCHRGIYMKLKEKGGKHRIYCTRCHTQFHSYNPVQGNWQEIMPKCSSCHKEPHGPKFPDCLKCHQEPHTPRVVPNTDYLAASCNSCHTNEDAQLRKFKSAHTEQGCDACHTKHGLIPSCLNCHEPHTPDQQASTCTSCHPAHKPLKIHFSKDTDSKTCSACHKDEYAKWSQTPSKHGKVNCSLCHKEHAWIPDCKMCHQQPHPKNLLARFPKCLDCHLDVHDLPIKKQGWLHEGTGIVQPGAS